MMRLQERAASAVYLFCARVALETPPRGPSTSPLEGLDRETPWQALPLRLAPKTLRLCGARVRPSASTT
jgi:hypothetical protein